MRQRNIRQAAGPTAALLLACVTLVCGGCRDSAGPAAAPAIRVDGDAVVVDAAAPQMQALEIEPVQRRTAAVHAFTGRMAWDENVTVRIYSPVAGRVASVIGEAGQTVTAGEALALIKSPDFGQVQADVRKAAADLALAKRTVERQRDLYAHGAAAKQELESAEADYQRAVSENERSLSALAAYGGRTGRVDDEFALASPLAGVVVERNLTPGQQIRPDQMLASDPSQLQPLFVVTDPTKLWVLLDVAEADLAALQPGQQLAVHARAYPNRSFPGHLQLIGAALDPATRTVKARGMVDNATGLLKAEMYVSVDVTDAEASLPGVEIPTAAHFVDGDHNYVFVETEPGHFRRTPVQLGPESDHRLAVLNGLSPGQRVVTRGGLLLQQILDSTSAG